jgi:hypothetical protein
MIRVTEDEYCEWFVGYGFQRTGNQTALTEEWENESGVTIMVTKASELSPDDRLAAVERMRRTLGIGFPKGGGGVH